MGLFKRIFKKKEKQFSLVEGRELCLENQNGRILSPTKEDLKNYLNLLFDDEDQFITLTLEKANLGVRYIQACFVGTQLIVQLGLEKNNKTVLVEKKCTSKECLEIFYTFYDFGRVDSIDEYKPVQF